MPWVLIEKSPTFQGERELSHSPAWLGFGLVAIGVSGVLAMVATWFLVDLYPIPDDDAIHLGVLIFCFVVFFDVLLIYRIARSEIRQGQRMGAVKWAAGLILLGLPVAAAAGSLPWLLDRLYAALPWMSGIHWGLLLAWLAIANVFWQRRRARKAS